MEATGEFMAGPGQTLQHAALDKSMWQFNDGDMLEALSRSDNFSNEDEMKRIDALSKCQKFELRK